MKFFSFVTRVLVGFMVLGIVHLAMVSNGQVSGQSDGHPKGGCGISGYSSILIISFTDDNLESEEYEREADLSLQFRLTNYTRSENFARIQIETKFSNGVGPVTSSLVIQGGHQWARGEMEAMIASLSASYTLSRYRQVRYFQDYEYKKQGVLFWCTEPLRPNPRPLISELDSGFAPDKYAEGYWPAMGNVNSIIIGDFREEWSENGKFYKWYWRKTAAEAKGDIYNHRTLYMWKLNDSRDVLLAENEDVSFLVHVANTHGMHTLTLILQR